MTATASAMVVNLHEQVRLYRHLLELSTAQLVALRDQDVHSVHAILQEMEIAMLERSKVEQRREALIVAIAAELGVPAHDVTASLLSSATEDEAIGEAIRQSSHELGELVEQLSMVVERNRMLLEQELSIIDHLVKGLTEVPAAPTYEHTGAQAERMRLKLLDAKV